MGSKPACDSCAKVARTCEWPMPGRAWSCKHCVRSKMKCTVSGAPQSMKRIRATTEEEAGPSQRGEDDPLFLESESEDGAETRTETVGSEVPGSAVTELTEALRAQMSAMQGQVHLEERLCAQMEGLSISLDQHWNAQQELLEALQVAVRGFGHGLGWGWTHGPGSPWDGRSGLREMRTRGKGGGMGRMTPYLR